jgi:transcriptional regulator with XRE-family HTH domain
VKAIDPTLAGGMRGDSFGKRMKSAREHAGIAHQVAADRIGLSARQLRRVEAGNVRMVSNRDVLLNAAKAYGVQSVWLYAGAMAGNKLVPPWYRVPVPAIIEGKSATAYIGDEFSATGREAAYEAREDERCYV